jgi:hypothetical protein
MMVPNVNVKELEHIQKMMCDSRLRYGFGKGDRKSLMQFMEDSVRKFKVSQKAQQRKV